MDSTHQPKSRNATRPLRRRSFFISWTTICVTWNQQSVLTEDRLEARSKHWFLRWIIDPVSPLSLPSCRGRWKPLLTSARPSYVLGKCFPWLRDVIWVLGEVLNVCRLCVCRLKRRLYWPWKCVQVSYGLVYGQAFFKTTTTKQQQNDNNNKQQQQQATPTTTTTTTAKQQERFLLL